MQLQRRLDYVTALVVGTVIYVVYLALLGFSSLPWHVYALTIPSGIGAAALISIPITYLQDLIAKRPGLGSALISVNMFLGGGISALLFALGTWASGYSGTAILGAGAGTVGLLLLLILERRATNLRGRLMDPARISVGSKVETERSRELQNTKVRRTAAYAIPFATEGNVPEEGEYSVKEIFKLATASPFPQGRYAHPRRERSGAYARVALPGHREGRCHGTRPSSRGR